MGTRSKVICALPDPIRCLDRHAAVVRDSGRPVRPYRARAGPRMLGVGQQHRVVDGPQLQRRAAHMRGMGAAQHLEVVLHVLADLQDRRVFEHRASGSPAHRASGHLAVGQAGGGGGVRGGVGGEQVVGAARPRVALAARVSVAVGRIHDLVGQRHVARAPRPGGSATRRPNRRASRPGRWFRCPRRRRRRPRSGRSTRSRAAVSRTTS